MDVFQLVRERKQSIGNFLANILERIDYLLAFSGFDEPDAPTVPAAPSAGITLAPLKHNVRLAQWCYVAVKKFESSSATDGTKKAAIYEALMGADLPFKTAKPHLANSALLAGAVLSKLATELPDFVYKHRKPFWPKWEK